MGVFLFGTLNVDTTRSMAVCLTLSIVMVLLGFGLHQIAGDLDWASRPRLIKGNGPPLVTKGSTELATGSKLGTRDNHPSVETLLAWSRNLAFAVCFGSVFPAPAWVFSSDGQAYCASSSFLGRIESIAGSEPLTIAFYATLLSGGASLLLITALQGKLEAVSAARALDDGARDPRPPWLLLRAFGERTLEAGFVRVSYQSGYGYHSSNSSGAWILRIVEALRPIGRVVAIGRAHERADSTTSMRGMVILTETEDTWQERVEQVALAARGIFLVPEKTDGCLFEIDMLVRHALHARVIVWMPPANDLIAIERLQGVQAVGPTPAERWEAVRTDLTARGLHLPEYDRRGMMYIPNADFSIRGGYWLYDECYAGRCLLELAPMLQGDSKPLAQVIEG